jgi:hypothetical protein
MDKRTEYVEKLSAQMVEWDVQIERLKEKIEFAAAEVKFTYANTIAALQLKRDEAALQLQGISTASDDEWEELKTGAEQTWEAISNALRDAIVKTQ